MTGTVTRALWRGVAAAFVTLAVLPLPDWLDGPDAGPLWTPQVAAWAIGTLVVAMAAIVVGRAATAVKWPRRSFPNIPSWPIVAVVGVGFAVASALAMDQAFSRNPHLVDEMAQLLHARAFAAGRLALPPPEPPAFFVVTHTGLTDAGWVSQYPPGQTVLLAAGLLAGLEWLVNPLLGGIGVLLVFVLARGLFDTRTGIAAALLFALSPWVLFTSATYLNHVGAVTCALASWALVWGPARRTALHWCLAGLALGLCAATRPLDAVAAMVPILVPLVGARRVAPWLQLALGGLPVAVAWGFVNLRLYGSPLTLGYTALYGPEHGLGFHTDPWGLAYTPLTALSNLGVAVRRLHIYVFEWPIPGLLPLVVWALAARQDDHGDAVTALALIAPLGLYFFYWHSGYYLGPRLHYGVAPWLAIAMARAWGWAWTRVRLLPARPVRSNVALAAAAVIVVAWGVVDMVPKRWAVYRDGLVSLKRHPERQLAEAGVRQALVIIPESWGSRIIANLWGLGVPPGLVERAYRSLDACDLHRFGDRARRGKLPARVVIDSLERRIADAGPQPPLVDRWPDPTLRMRPRESVPPECRVELERDLRGFTLYGNHAWRNPVGLDRGIVFARDLYDYNEELFARYQGWEIWRFAPTEGAGARPRLVRVR